MSRFLSETNIELLENFIATNEPYSSDLLPAISECYRNDAINDWKTINDPDTPVTTYLQFASAALGMTSYGFYKTKDGRIFLVTAWCSELNCYYHVNSTWHILIPYEQYIKKQSDALLYSDNNHTNEDCAECSTS
jgi:hypothetical protein